jgi:thioredoxin reductase (NADPH)
MINTNEIENYAGTGKLSGAELAVRMFEHTRELGVPFEYGTVSGITDEGVLKTVVCKAEQAVYTTRSVILATGTVPRRLGVPGEDRWAGNGISWCAVCDGAQYRDRNVVVIGGGNSAVEESLYLAEICAGVTLITMLDLTADHKACGHLRNRGNVDIHVHQEILDFTGTDRLTGVSFRSAGEDKTERHVACDGVFEYIGFRASSETFRDLGITDATGCIAVDSRMKTSRPGIFGAGDVTAKHLRQIVTSCADGAIAANSAASYIKSLQ